MRTVPLSLVLTLLLGLFLAGACSSTPTLRTQSLSQPPTVDGTLSEWGGTLARVGDSEVSMSVVPTDSLLYVALLIPDQSLIRSIAKKGLIVWVDPAGKRAHTYGVQYPLALQAQRDAQKSASAPGGSGAAPTLDQLFPSDLALIRNDTIRHRMPARLSSGLRVQATLNTGALIYELAIPVARTASGASGQRLKYGLHAPLGRTLSVGLETPESGDDSNLMDRTEGIPSVTGGGRGRRGRSPRGRRRGRRGRQQPSVSQSPSLSTLELWTEVVSAKR